MGLEVLIFLINFLDELEFFTDKNDVEEKNP
jgi:hypothetical protein